MGKEYTVECKEGHRTKYITNNGINDIILCPKIVDGSPCKLECSIISGGEELDGELEIEVKKNQIFTFFRSIVTFNVSHRTCALCR